MLVICPYHWYYKNLRINGKYYAIPIATEEPSVIAAFKWCIQSTRECEFGVFSLGESIRNCFSNLYQDTNKDLSNTLILAFFDKIYVWSKPLLCNMHGREVEDFRRITTKFIGEIDIQKLNVYIDTCKMLWVHNLLNAVAESSTSSYFGVWT